tara:strand:+ start:243 stop:455 length:213 start_codon:yes stop_codon:yes gene_type:complete
MERKFRVGDLIHEQHFPERKGVVIEIIETWPPTETSQVVVQWAGRNPNSYTAGPEKIEERYLILLSRKEK